jgi:hypothetical protein
MTLPQSGQLLTLQGRQGVSYTSHLASECGRVCNTHLYYVWQHESGLRQQQLLVPWPAPRSKGLCARMTMRGPRHVHTQQQHCMDEPCAKFTVPPAAAMMLVFVQVTECLSTAIRFCTAV